MTTTIDSHVRSLEQAVQAWDARGWPRPEVALVSGSGLAVDLYPPTHGPVPLTDVLPFPIHSIVGHPLQAELLEPCPGRHVLYYRGRIHSYQGHDAYQTVFQVRLAALLGARTVILTNASGSLSPERPPGTLVVLDDHLNLTGLNPLRGELPEEWGPRFPDMSGAYDPDLRRLIHSLAADLGIELSSGVYAGLAGPSYETPAEVRMLGHLGADLVGMSTVLEVIAARHMGVRCLGVSLATNLAAGVPGSEESLGHDEVLDTGKAAAARVQKLFRRLLEADELVRAPAG